MAVEHAIIDANHRHKFSAVGYDPYQAALMAQRCEARDVPMQEMTFASSNLNLMASTLLDVFRSRRLELYNHPALIADLGRLTIEEKSYGHRLSATRNECGHADLATGLAISLPLAVDRAGKPPIVLRPLFGAGAVDTVDGYIGRHPYGDTMVAWERRQEEYRREEQRLQEPDDDEEWRQLMRLVGRCS